MIKQSSRHQIGRTDLDKDRPSCEEQRRIPSRFARQGQNLGNGKESLDPNQVPDWDHVGTDMLRGQGALPLVMRNRALWGFGHFGFETRKEMRLDGHGRILRTDQPASNIPVKPPEPGMGGLMSLERGGRGSGGSGGWPVPAVQILSPQDSTSAYKAVREAQTSAQDVASILKG